MEESVPRPIRAAFEKDVTRDNLAEEMALPVSWELKRRKKHPKQRATDYKAKSNHESPRMGREWGWIGAIYKVEPK